MSVLVSKPAPFFHDNEKKFNAVLPNNQIINDFNFKEASKNKYSVLFFYPLDFTFVCPSEIIAFNNRLEEFKKLNVEIFSVSIDSEFSHYAWKNTPIEKGGIGNIQFTMISDIKGEIIRAYDVESSNGVAFRGSFLIDKEGIVQHQVVNNLPLGRNIDEMIRMVEALQFTEKHGEVCPAGWNKGKEAIKPNKEGISSYLKNNSKDI